MAVVFDIPDTPENLEVAAKIWPAMTPLEMIAEWRKGCTDGGPPFDQVAGNPPGTTSPAQCIECTDALINAIEDTFRNRTG